MEMNIKVEYAFRNR